MTDIKYWESFYKNFNENKPSSFAKYLIKNKYLKKKDIVLDIGCGNGRDSMFFLKKNIKTIGIDNAISTLLSKSYLPDDIFINLDISKINSKIKFFQEFKINCIYSRFLVHAISPDVERKLFKFVKKFQEKNHLFLMEFRTINDPLINKGKKISRFERLTSHYRRFIEPTNILNEFKDSHKLLYYKSSKRFSSYLGEKPNICRIILKKK